MLSPAEADVLAALKAGLRARFGPRLMELVLFGSRARGDGRDDSDLDVLVGVRGLSAMDRRDAIDLAADLSLDSGLVLSPLVLDIDAPAPIRERALTEGIAL